MSSIRNSLLLILLLAVVAQADPYITVENYTIDSVTTTRTYDPLAIPRWQIACFQGAGDLAIYMANGFPLSDTRWYVTHNLDSTTRWVEKWRLSPTGSTNHAHTSVYSDTIYVSKLSDRKMHAHAPAENVNPNDTLPQLFEASFGGLTSDDDLYTAPVLRIPNSDTVICVSRGTNEPGNTNLLWWLSDDKGQTFDSMGLALNWTSMAGPIRIGLFVYDTTVGLVADAHDTAIVIARYNRTAHTWTSLGSAISLSSDAFRCFGANTLRDTSLFVLMSKDDVGASDYDSLLYAYSHNAGGSWTRSALYMGSGSEGATNFAPYATLTYLEASKRLVLFYNIHSGSTVDLFCRYWKEATSEWSDTIRVTNNGVSYKFTSCQIVPASHGDVAYLSYPQDTVISSTTYHTARIARVTFQEPTADTITLTALPDTLAQDSTVYILTSDLTSQTFGLTIKDSLHDVIVDGQGYKIRWHADSHECTDTAAATTGGNSIKDATAVWMRQLKARNITFRNIVFEHAVAADSLVDSLWHAWGLGVRLGGAGQANITFDNCTFIVKGRNSRVMYTDNAGTISYNVDILNCTFYDSCNSWARRDQWGQQAMLNLGNNNFAAGSALYHDDGIPFQYHFKIDGCSTAVAFWANVHLEGDSTVAQISNSYFYSDGWNRLTAALSWTSGDNATENYPLAIRASGPYPECNRIKVFGNTIRSGSDHTGSRGIFISGVDGINWLYDDSCVAIYNNDIVCHQGFDGYVTQGIGIIIRDDWSNVRIYNNTVEMPHYVSPPNGSHGDGPGMCFRLTANTGENLYFKHNTLKGYFADAFTFSDENGEDGQSITCIGTDECDMWSGNILIDSNILYTNNLFFDIGFYNGNGGNFQCLGNTFRYWGGTSPNDAETWTWYASLAGSSRDNAYSNYIIDGVFDSSVSPRHIFLSDAEEDTLQVGLKYTVPITVLDGSAVPVAGATVTVTNDYGNVIASGTTDGIGQFIPVLKTGDYFNDTWGAGVVDSAGYNPFIFHVEYGVDSDDSTYTVDWDAKSITLTLGTTVAPPTPPSVTLRRGLNLRRGVNIGTVERGPGPGSEEEPPLP